MCNRLPLHIPGNCPPFPGQSLEELWELLIGSDEADKPEVIAELWKKIPPTNNEETNMSKREDLLRIMKLEAINALDRMKAKLQGRLEGMNKEDDAALIQIGLNEPGGYTALGVRKEIQLDGVHSRFTVMVVNADAGEKMMELYKAWQAKEHEQPDGFGNMKR